MLSVGLVGELNFKVYMLPAKHPRQRIIVESRKILALEFFDSQNN